MLLPFQPRQLQWAPAAVVRLRARRAGGAPTRGGGRRRGSSAAALRATGQAGAATGAGGGVGMNVCARGFAWDIQNGTERFIY